MVSYLGDTKESKDFAKQFVEKRNRSRNQARLEKQQEEVKFLELCLQTAA